MIRIFSILIGAFFSLALLLAFGTGAYSYITEPPAKTAEARFHLKPEHLALSSNGWFGKYDKAKRKYFADAHNRLSSPLYCLVFGLIGVYALVGGTFNRRGYGGRIALACAVVLLARLPGFAFQQMTTKNPDFAFTMYVWPALWIFGIIFLLSVPRFEYLKGSNTPPAPAGGA